MTIDFNYNEKSREYFCEFVIENALDSGITHIFSIKKNEENNQLIYSVRTGGLGDERDLFKFRSEDYFDKSLENINESRLYMMLYKQFEKHDLRLADLSDDKKLYCAEIEKNKLWINLTLNEIINSLSLPSYGDIKRDIFNIGPEKDKNGDILIKEDMTINIENNRVFYLDFEQKRIFAVKYVEDKNGDLQPRYIIFINAIPHRIEIQQSPINGCVIKYQVDFISSIGQYKLSIGPCSISNMVSELKENSLILISSGAEDNLGQIFAHLEKKGLVNKKYGINEPGFFYLESTKKIVAVDFNHDLPSREEIDSALELIEDFSYYYSNSDGKSSGIDQRDKLATILKLTMTSPFDYCRKQMGLSESILPIFCHGKPGSSKTTMLLLVAYIYGLHLVDYECAGSSVGTEARFSELMGKSTFPTLIDECANVFDDKNLTELNKTGLRRLYVRNKLSRSGVKTREPAYSTFLYASNYNPIQNSLDGTARRYYLLRFDENEHKDETDFEVAEFNERFRLREPDSPLKRLNFIGKFIANKIINEPELLKTDPKNLGDKLFDMLYDYAGKKKTIMASKLGF